MPTDILALDLATRTGIARGVVGETPALRVLDFGRGGVEDAACFGRLTLWLATLLRDEPPDAIAVERPIPVHDSTLLYGLRGIALGCAYAKRVRVLQVPIATWRKYVLGDGKLPGLVAKARCVELCAQLGWEVPKTRAGWPDHNAAEAAGIWLWACAELEPGKVQRSEPLFVAGARP